MARSCHTPDTPGFSPGSGFIDFFVMRRRGIWGMGKGRDKAYVDEKANDMGLKKNLTGGITRVIL